jgi:hypothetical protein
MLPSTGVEKKPCVGWKKFQEELPTAEQLRQWDREFRPARWGLVTGALAGVIVADFDGEKGIELMHKWGINPHLRTGSGGFHAYLQHPGWHVPTLNSKSGKFSWPWPGLDIRGDGGFAVALGSNCKGPYVWLRDLVPEPFDVLPEEVRTFLANHREQKYKPPETSVQSTDGRRVDWESIVRAALKMASRDGRNNAGFWLACQLRDNEFSSGEAESAMRDYRSRVPSANTKGKRELYTEAEMMASLHEAYSKPPRKPWAASNLRTQPNSTPPTQGHSGCDDGNVLTNKDETGPGEGAEDPTSVDVYVGCTGVPLLGYPYIPPSRTKYARVPREVYTDPRLDVRDVRIYCVLASACWQGSVTQIGKRLIAKEACCAERKVISSLRRLEATGHIQKQAGRRRGHRAIYVLLSPVFCQEELAADIPPARKRYARVQREVYTDPRLEARGVRIYCVLASSCWQGSVAQVGKRLIAKEACCAECDVISSLRKIEAAGHIQKHAGRRRGHRAMYVLLSSVFGQKQRAGVEEVVSGPDGRLRLVTVRKDIRGVSSVGQNRYGGVPPIPALRLGRRAVVLRSSLELWKAQVESRAAGGRLVGSLNVDAVGASRSKD